MIDRFMNYGMHFIEGYLRHSLPFRSVLDIRLLRDNGINVKTADFERERLPFQNGSVHIVPQRAPGNRSASTFLWVEKQREYAVKFLAFSGTKGRGTNSYLGER